MRWAKEANSVTNLSVGDGATVSGSRFWAVPLVIVILILRLIGHLDAELVLGVPG